MNLVSYLILVNRLNRLFNRTKEGFLLSIKILKAVICFFLAGCPSLEAAQNKSFTDSKFRAFQRHLGRAAVQSFNSPMTWGPGIAAIAFYLTPLDKEVSSWASSRTPIFGSLGAAHRTGDFLLSASRSIYIATAALELGVKGFAEPFHWSSLAAPLAAGGLAVQATSLGTALVKESAGRIRPDLSDSRSFLSGHSSMTSMFTTLSAANIHALTLPGLSEPLMDGALFTLTAGTAWSRVEGKNHYPSDVLAGAAFGHFLGVFFSNLLRPVPGNSPVKMNMNLNVLDHQYALRLVLPVK